MQYVKSSEEADEIVNDAFIVLWEKQSELELSDTIKPLLYTIVRNKSLNLLKKKKIQITELDNGFEVIASDNYSPLEELQAKETEERVFKLIDQLPPRCKQIFVLSRKEHMSNKQIAELMELNEKTIENQISIGIRFIRNGLRAKSNKGKNTILIFPWLIAYLLQETLT
jgi:RNA polymerase sigma-70 factor (ECF subfamily)